MNHIVQRVVSGMRPTGKLHLGHYHGTLKNWLELQYQYECYFCAVDWHALTTHYDEPQNIESFVYDMVIDWLAVGIDPNTAHLFIQSQVPEHAELHVLLSMFTPLSWLERVPTYKDQQQKLAHKDLSTYGFLGYPLLQTADILAYRANLVPVGEDQLPHIELSREIARRFNFLYGREPDFAEKLEESLQKMGKKHIIRFKELKKEYQEQGHHDALEKGKALLESMQGLNLSDTARLLGDLEGGGKAILPEPEAALTHVPWVVGIDGRKMSKSYDNTIGLREDPLVVEGKIRTMTTDPARIRRTDPGEPEKCPVWSLHKIYSSEETKQWVQTGCRTAGIGCLDCKKSLHSTVEESLVPIRERAKAYEENPTLVRNILEQGAEVARDVAKSTLKEVRKVMGLQYS